MEPLNIGDKVGDYELFEIKERAGAMWYSFRRAGESLSLWWPLRIDPPSASDLASYLGRAEAIMGEQR